MPRRDFPSFGMLTDEGDIAVHRMVTCVVTDINAGRIRRIELEGRIKLGCTWVDETGHREVWGTQPQGDIEDAINRACLAQGWQRVVVP
jgi:hypothetical protein